jgi:hypothetical protein
MAEETQTSQTVEKPVQDAPIEPGIDSLLPTIPGLKELFEEKPGTPEQGQPKEAPVTEPGVSETVTEVEIPEGLKPEGEKPPEPQPEPKKEELSDKVQKRIDELTAKRKTAEERATSLEAELTDLKSKFQAPPPVAPTPASPLADIETEGDLAARTNHILEAKSWAIQNLDGGQVSDGNGGTKWIDGPTVKSILANAENMLSKHIPERRDFIANKKVWDAEARREYPALFKEGTEPYKVYQQWLNVFPECRRYPDVAVIVGDALVGKQIRENRGKARSSNGRVPPANQTPLAAPAPAASPRVPQTKALSGEALQAAFAANPDAALNSFVDSLIEGGASSQRTAQR